MVTIGEKLAARRGIGPGFDALRVTLAIGIVLWHSFALSRDDVCLDCIRPVWIAGYVMLFLFFGLSGFLIAGSASRLGLGNFLINRGLRIFPALLVEIILSAFVLGPLVTILPLEAYFSSGQTYHYMTNLIGLMNFELPGVFAQNVDTGVNWSLWTVPYEFGCYLIISLMIGFGLLRFPKAITWSAIGLVLAGLAADLIIRNAPGLDPIAGKLIVTLFVGRGARLPVAFVGGIAIYLLRDRIRYSAALFGAAAAIVAAVALIGPSPQMTDPIKTLLLAAPLTYMMAFLGVSALPVLPVVHRGDYSYGIYLYGMPVQQVMIAALPQVRDPWAQFALAAPVILLCAILSWHLIEKPILALRKRLSFVARIRGVAEATDSKVGAPGPAAAEAPDARS